MTTFRYKGQTAGGAKVSGVLRAYDEFEAADKLRESVAIITKLEAVPEKKESVLSRPVAFRVKEKGWRSCAPNSPSFWPPGCRWSAACPW